MLTIKDQFDHICTHTGKLLDYGQDAKLLLSAETGYDSQFFSYLLEVLEKIITPN